MERTNYAAKIEEMSSYELNRLEAGSISQVECVGDTVNPASRKLYLVEYKPQAKKVEPQVESKSSEIDGSVRESELLTIPLTEKQVELLQEQHKLTMKMFFADKPGSILAQVYPNMGEFKCKVLNHKETALVRKALKKYQKRLAKAERKAAQ